MFTAMAETTEVSLHFSTNDTGMLRLLSSSRNFKHCMYTVSYSRTGQLGHGAELTGNWDSEEDTSDIPVRARLPEDKVPVDVQCGAYSSAALMSDGSLFAWGNNHDGK